MHPNQITALAQSYDSLSIACYTNMNRSLTDPSFV